MADFTGIEKENIRRIVRIPRTDKSELVEKLLALDADEATSLRADIVAWNKIKYGTTKSKGGIKGTDYDMERDRMDITNTVRELLDYPKIHYIGADEFGILNFNVPNWTQGDSDEFSS